jgi:hypothetical protein
LLTATDFGKLNGFECLPAFVRFDFLAELSVFTGCFGHEPRLPIDNLFHHEMTEKRH